MLTAIAAIPEAVARAVRESMPQTPVQNQQQQSNSQGSNPPPSNAQGSNNGGGGASNSGGNQGNAGNEQSPKRKSFADWFFG